MRRFDKFFLDAKRRRKIEPLQPSYDEISSTNRRLHHEVKHLRDDVAYLEELVRHLKRLRFAPKSEITAPGQRTLFNEAETIAATSPDANIDESGKAKKPRKRGRPFFKLKILGAHEMKYALTG